MSASSFRCAVIVASLLLGAAPAKAEDVAYVTNFRSGTLSVLRIDADEPPATMPLAWNADTVQQLPGENPNGAVAGLAVGGPVAVALSPDGRFAYVVQSGTPGALLVVDTHQRSVAAAIPLEADPFALAVSPDGREIWVANFAVDKVSVVDAATRRVTTTVAVGHGPGGIAMNGERAYVANTAANSVSVVEARTHKVIGEIAVGRAPVGVALSRDRLFSTDSGDDSVSVIRTADNALVTHVKVGKAPTAVALSPDANFAFVTNVAGNSVSVIDTATNLVTATVSVGREPFGLAVSGDGARLVVANRGANSISILDTRTHSLLRDVAVGTAPFGVATRAGRGDSCHCSIQPAHARHAWAPAALLVPLLLRRIWTRRRRRGVAQSV